MNQTISRLSKAVLILTMSLGCGIGSAEERGAQPPEAQGWRYVEVADGISHPWGMAWLPSGELLVTSRAGRLYRLSASRFVEVPMEGLPQVFAQGQGGLLDIAVHPRGGEKPLIYMTMATGTSSANRTTLVRGVYDDGRVTEIEKIFQVEPDKAGGEHFGSRLVWLDDETLLMSIGDGGNPPRQIGGMLARDQAQNLRTHLGSILRLSEDGTAAHGNPHVGRADAKSEIWSNGHRNIQGMVRDPRTGRVWATEHGPRGGDELNLIIRGKNYGWPLQSHGRDYRTNEPVGRPHVPGMEDPKKFWDPVIGASGLAVYYGPHFPEWEGDIFAGGLVTQDVRRLTVNEDGDVVREERLPIGARVRDVRLGPDGYLYVLTDESNGRLLKIVPR